MPEFDVKEWEDWLTRSQVCERLRKRFGWNITPETWRKRCAEYGPSPIHVGRTPLWHYTVVDQTAKNRPGQGARTDLKRKESA